MADLLRAAPSNQMCAASGKPRESRQTGFGISSQISLRSFDRAAIWSGVTSRRARISEIEADVGFACESAAIGRAGRTETKAREDWDEDTWRRYLAEAVSQARLCSTELNALRQEASHLERLARTTGTE